jgi:hypothetical protein|tara:strand:- start:8300 stop:8668 length:369 start_codon:yes stop_codon:yes gene_type:complete
MAIGKVLVSTSKQIMDLWKAGLLRKGIAPAVQDALEASVRAKGWIQLAPKEFLQEVNRSHSLNLVPSVLPKIKIQEAGMAVKQAARNNPKPKIRLANKAESKRQKMKRLGFKVKKDPKVREY